MAEPVQIGILLYPNVTQLDATGPAQVLCRVPGATLHMIWKTRDPVPTDAGFSIVPTRNTESRATTAVEFSSLVMAVPRDHCSPPSSACA